MSIRDYIQEIYDDLSPRVLGGIMFVVGTILTYWKLLMPIRDAAANANVVRIGFGYTVSIPFLLVFGLHLVFC